ncbi:putative aarF domain-containing kinase chloroplastic [Micractinium conductrix]|uniref:AarF domain-containing kinase chloroplastic n=1 Tax=Micractinium conductrix TaxID=554055 RepID=A0A2P6V6E4_9CHLO|nr:putative aarF domain-containing kinase chloroplastic [Micractinium conductrix]|eukprot:PSC69658.1 putative aarF domain-containing kinase chloroplastic [Micractinium conductrix]
MEAVSRTGPQRLAAPARPAAPRRHTTAAAIPQYVPYSAQPPAPELPALVFQAPVRLAPTAFPSLPAAPNLTTLPVELLDQRATAPHWGSQALSDAAAAAAASLRPAGAHQLAAALRDVQTNLSENVRTLSELVQQAGAPASSSSSSSSSGSPAASSGMQDGLAAVAAQLQQVAAAAREAASAVTALELERPSSSSSSSSLPTRNFSSLPDMDAASLGSQLQALAGAEYAGYSLQTLALISSGVAALVALSVPRSGGDDDAPGGGAGGGDGRGGTGSVAGGRGDVLPTSWDAAAVEEYYRKRPTLVLQRVLQVAAEAASYGAALAADMATGSVERNAFARADQAMAAIEGLGPAYVKVAQAMSTRVDLLTPAYLVAIQRLQDQVPPFPDAEAYASIERAFGRPLGQVFSTLSDSAVAAASLGQVYKGTLRESGREVAIKVRRPGVLESVSLDLYLMRQVGVALRKVPDVKSDWAGIIDAWAMRFLDEMNYELEAANTLQFQRDLASLPGIVIPDVVTEGSTTDVLVLGWVDGERLTDSRAADVRQLCDTLLSAYLIQLLDTGLLHADPHPGNLLRTTDGRIAILDHGLIQEIPRDYALALMEYIAHLSVGDWDSLVDDLVALGFVDSVEDKQLLVGPLGAILTQLTAGGGAKKVNIKVVMDEIEKMTQAYDFRVPPYFALILRTFSVIEGIALQADPDYSIVKECFPYLSRRLLTDDDPRARAALRQLLFAGGDQISLDRLERLVQGLSNFTVEGLGSGDAPALGVIGSASGAGARARGSSSGSNGASVQRQAQAQQRPQAPLLDSTAKEVLAAVFSVRPTYVQELLVGQAVGTVDAAGRQLAAALLAPALGGLATAAQTAMVPGGGPMALINRLPSLVELSPADQQQLATARGITALVQQAAGGPPGGGAPALTPRQAADLGAQLLRELGPMLPTLLPGMAATGQLFARELAQRGVDRITAVVAPGGPAGGDLNYQPPMDL